MADLDQLLPDDWTPEGAAEGGGDFDPIPPGWYDARITGAEMGESSAGTAWMLKLTLDVEGPSHAGRKLWDNLIITHESSAKAIEIGHQRLGELCVASGFNAKPKAHEFLGKVVSAKVKIRKSEEWGDRNEVKEYRPTGSSTPAATGGKNDDPPF